MSSVRERDFTPEFTFRASRSSGPGGQNVNKVSSKMELRFRVADSMLLSEMEKELLFTNLAGRINSNGEMVLVSQTERSQGANKEKVIERFYQLIEKALRPKKPRKKTKPSPAVREKRLELKKKQSEKKESRQKVVNKH